jgi:hypothetical protein
MERTKMGKMIKLVRVLPTKLKKPNEHTALKCTSFRFTLQADISLGWTTCFLPQKIWAKFIYFNIWNKGRINLYSVISESYKPAIQCILLALEVASKSTQWAVLHIQYMMEL